MEENNAAVVEAADENKPASEESIATSVEAVEENMPASEEDEPESVEAVVEENEPISEESSAAVVEAVEEEELTSEENTAVAEAVEEDEPTSEENAAEVEAVVEEDEPTSEESTTVVEAVVEEDEPTPVEAREENEPASEVDKPTSIAELEPKMNLDGTVSRLELYGAFIDIGVGTNALIHISKLAKQHVNRVSDVLQVGDVVSIWIEKINPEQGQIMVTMIEPLAVDWTDLKKGQTLTGTIARLENYGAFVDVGAERDGLVHISEISHDYVKHPSEVLSVGDEVQVEVLDFNRRKKRIDLSIKNLQEKPESAVVATGGYKASDPVDDFEDEPEEVPTAMEVALRKAMGDEPIDAIEGQGKRNQRGRRRRKNRRKAQDDLLDRTLQYQQEG